ncbi:MAG: aminotransferase class I/II-fold pyridoxal phosphate-dependent enzyme [Candidatus Latescibacteria bacterium]|nr:aminotransferase class I/II-fold pyridoxal phosphate-dependent enzyme [Candidatus Latescibacterota bacterium]
MKAVIPAAGYGNRMRPLTDTRHKTLLEVGGRTIIGRIIDGLLETGVARILVVTGYRAEELARHLETHHPEVAFQFVRNLRYRETNNIFSLALAFEHLELDEDLLLIESDLVCEASVFARIVASPYPDVALVDRYHTGMDGTVVTLADGIVTSVIPPHLQAGDFSFADKFKTLNIYKFSQEFCRSSFRHLLTYYAQTIDDNCYYELILGILIYLQKAVIHAEMIGDEQWAEIDDPNDLRVAEFLFSPLNRRRLLEESMGEYWSFEDDFTDFCFLPNMYFPTPSMLAELRNNLIRLVQNYGSNQEILNWKLALFLLCSPERVQVLNGLSQIYPLLASHYAGQRILLPSPTFGEYRRSFSAHTVYHDRPGIDLDELAARAADAEVVVIVNPNNPTGTTLPAEWILHLARTLPDTAFLVDESFISFSTEPSLVPSLERDPLPNVVVLTSLSKTLGVPGVRLGYVYSCDERLNTEITSALPIWNLNSLA